MRGGRLMWQPLPLNGCARDVRTASRDSIGLEQRSSCQQFPEHDAECPDVGTACPPGALPACSGLM